MQWWLEQLRDHQETAAKYNRVVSINVTRKNMENPAGPSLAAEGDLSEEPYACIVTWEMDAQKWAFFTANGQYLTSNIREAGYLLQKWMACNEFFSVGEIDPVNGEVFYVNYRYRKASPQYSEIVVWAFLLAAVVLCGLSVASLRGI